MNNFTSKKNMNIFIFVLIAVITLGVGYAAITAITLTIEGNASANVNQENFKVHFTGTPTITTGTGSATIDSSDNTVATLEVTGLTKKGDKGVAEYTVINESEGIGASISLDLTNSNTEYFKITETIDDTQLKAGETTKVTLIVELTKTPITDTVSTSITGTLTASPIEDDEATGGEQKEVIRPVPVSYTYLIRGYDEQYTNITNGIDSNVRTYSNFAAAKSEFGHPLAIALDMDNGSITASYIAFEKGGKVYYLTRPIVDEGSLEEKPTYDANVAVLKEAFGPDWESVCNDYGSYFSCSADGWGAYVSGGYVSAGVGSSYCNAFADGRVGCSS